MKRNAYRGTSFNLPCNRKFWKKCGDFDSLIQFQECAYRALMNDLSNKQKADSALVLDNYMKLLSAQVHVNLGGFKLPDFQNYMYAAYLVYPYANFDYFLNELVEDLAQLGIKIKIQKTYYKKRCTKLCQVLRQLKSKGINVSIDSYKTEMFDFYRLRRNAVVHMLPVSTYISAFNKVQKSKNQVLKTYPHQPSALQSANQINFDDFIVCTANLKNIADIIVRAIECHINWKNIGKTHPKWIDYRGFNSIYLLDRDRRIGYIRSKVASLYGVQLTDEECKCFF